MTNGDELILRLAMPADGPAIDALMQASIRAVFPSCYDQRQTESAVVYVGRVDRMLIDDRTLFVIEGVDGLVASGGWSRRDKLFSGSAEQEGRARLLDPATEPARIRAMFVRGDRTRRGLGTRILEASEAAARDEGFRRLSLMATLPGVPLYERFGFVARERVTITHPDGVELAGVEMGKDLGA
ncbi:MAG: GNAT family N-acetyltransferase [Chloroflexota bacterium]